MSAESELDYWRRVRVANRMTTIQLERAAKPLEERVSRLIGDSYVRIAGIDKDGRVRFYVREFASRTFSLEELSDA